MIQASICATLNGQGPSEHWRKRGLRDKCRCSRVAKFRVLGGDFSGRAGLARGHKGNPHSRLPASMVSRVNVLVAG